MKGTSPEGQGHLTLYLLGQLSEEEGAAIEDRYFLDPDYFARLEVAADDLADQYVRGHLSPHDRQRFERYCQGSADDQMRLRGARALLRYAEYSRAKAAPSIRGFLRARFARNPVAWVGGFASATVMMVILSLWLGAGVLRLRTERSRLVADLVAERQAAQAASRQASEDRGRVDRLERRLQELTTVAFSLVPGMTRGAGIDLRVPATAADLRLDLLLERAVPAGSIHVTLRDAGRVIVWSQDVRTVTADTVTVSVTLPAAIVTPGEYEVILERLNPVGAATELAVYSFRAVRGR